jgi:hypothetical protein
MLLLCVGLLPAALPMMAQEGGALPRDRVVLPGRDVSVEEAFREIERWTRFSIAYNVDKLDVHRRILLEKTVFFLPELLDRLLDGTGNAYAVSGKHVVILPAKGEPPPRRPTNAVPVAIAPPKGRDRDSLPPGVEPLGMSVEDLRLTPGVVGARFTGTRNAPDAPRGLLMKVNASGDALFLAPGVEVERGVNGRLSVAIAASLKTGGGGTRSLGGWTVRPELRFRRGELAGHFVGIHLIFRQYDVRGRSILLLGMESVYRYRGTAVGAGVSYGYNWSLTPSWGVEFDLGIGAALMTYRHGGRDDGVPRERGRHFYFGPTALGVKWVYKLDR